MSDLTVEKISEWVETHRHNFEFGGFPITEAFKFLLSDLELLSGLLEVEQEDCEMVRKNKELNWQRAIVAESKLHTIERETAEKCAELEEFEFCGMDDCCALDIELAIRKHFNLGETP